MKVKLTDLAIGTTCYLYENLSGDAYRTTEDPNIIKNIDSGETISIRSKRTEPTVYIDHSDLDTETMKRHLSNTFTWGTVVDVHMVGEYQIVEYHPRIFDGPFGTGQFEKEKTQFHPYIDCKDTSHSYGTLDHALAGVIAHKHEGPNGSAAMYFLRMLEIQDEE